MFIERKNTSITVYWRLKCTRGLQGSLKIIVTRQSSLGPRIILEDQQGHLNRGSLRLIIELNRVNVLFLNTGTKMVEFVTDGIGNRMEGL